MKSFLGNFTVHTGPGLVGFVVNGRSLNNERSRVRIRLKKTRRIFFRIMFFNKCRYRFKNGVIPASFLFIFVLFTFELN